VSPVLRDDAGITPIIGIDGGNGARWTVNERSG
jgi:hypothetical protein